MYWVAILRHMNREKIITKSFQEGHDWSRVLQESQNKIDVGSYCFEEVFPVKEEAIFFE